MNKNMELWINEHGLDLIGFTLLACGVVLIIKGLTTEGDGGILGWIINL